MMADYSGRRLYPQPSAGPAVDYGTLGKVEPTGIARGGTKPDFNALLRGLGVRVDKKPGIV